MRGESIAFLSLLMELRILLMTDGQECCNKEQQKNDTNDNSRSMAVESGLLNGLREMGKGGKFIVVLCLLVENSQAAFPLCGRHPSIYPFIHSSIQLRTPRRKLSAAERDGYLRTVGDV